MAYRFEPTREDMARLKISTESRPGIVSEVTAPLLGEKAWKYTALQPSMEPGSSGRLQLCTRAQNTAEFSRQFTELADAQGLRDNYSAYSFYTQAQNFVSKLSTGSEDVIDDSMGISTLKFRPKWSLVGSINMRVLNSDGSPLNWGDTDHWVDERSSHVQAYTVTPYDSSSQSRGERYSMLMALPGATFIAGTVESTAPGYYFTGPVTQSISRRLEEWQPNVKYDSGRALNVDIVPLVRVHVDSRGLPHYDVFDQVYRKVVFEASLVTEARSHESPLTRP